MYVRQNYLFFLIFLNKDQIGHVVQGHRSDSYLVFGSTVECLFNLLR